MTEDKIVTMNITYKDLTDILTVLEEWINDIRDSQDISRDRVIRLYYNLVNIWGDNASNG